MASCATALRGPAGARLWTSSPYEGQIARARRSPMRSPEASMNEVQVTRTFEQFERELRHGDPRLRPATSTRAPARSGDSPNSLRIARRRSRAPDRRPGNPVVADLGHVFRATPAPRVALWYSSPHCGPTERPGVGQRSRICPATARTPRHSRQAPMPITTTIELSADC